MLKIRTGKIILQKLIVDAVFPWMVNHQLVCMVWFNKLDSWLASAENGLHAVNNVAETEFRQTWDLYDVCFQLRSFLKLDIWIFTNKNLEWRLSD